MLQAEDATVQRLVDWATSEPSVRAVLLTGSRADPDASIDHLSDFDVILFLTEDTDLASRYDWLETFGTVMVKLDEQGHWRDAPLPTRLVQYVDGLRIDFTLAPMKMLHGIAAEGALPEELERGYRVLMDEDGATDRLPDPSGTAYVPRPPEQSEYRALVEEFWWEVAVAARSLARGELLTARYNMECVIRFRCLVPMLEWYAQVGHDWSRSVGPYGRGLADLLPPEDREALASTFGGSGAEEARAALAAAIALFRRAARSVADDLGFDYPEPIDREVAAYLDAIRSGSPSR